MDIHINENNIYAIPQVLHPQQQKTSNPEIIHLKQCLPFVLTALVYRHSPDRLPGKRHFKIS